MVNLRGTAAVCVALVRSYSTWAPMDSLLTSLGKGSLTLRLGMAFLAPCEAQPQRSANNFMPRAQSLWDGPIGYLYRFVGYRFER